MVCHRAAVGKNAINFLAKEDILQQFRFGKHVKQARKKYELYLMERVNKSKPGELSGGGLIRSKGGLSGMMGLLKEEGREEFDERILGGGDFVASVLREVDDKKDKNLSLDEVMKAVVEATGVRPEDMSSRSQNRQLVKARALYCYLVKERCGVSGAQLMKQLKMTSGAISHLVCKGREFNKSLTLSL
jgi:PIN domain nuclease of toxin-antitoxin system